MAIIQKGERLRAQIAEVSGMTREVKGMDNLLCEHFSWYHAGVLEYIRSLAGESAEISNLQGKDLYLRYLQVESLLRKARAIHVFFETASKKGIVETGVSGLYEIVFDPDEKKESSEKSVAVLTIIESLLAIQAMIKPRLN